MAKIRSIKDIATTIAELLGMSSKEAAISIKSGALDTLISRAKNLDASPVDIKKLEDIRKIKSSEKPLPKKPARVTELPRVSGDIGYGDFLFDGKTGSAAITAFRKNPMKRKDFMGDLKRQAIDEDLSDSQLREVIKRGREYWQKLSVGKTPYTATTKRFKETKKPTEEAKAAATTAALKSFNKIAREDIVGLLKQRGKPKLSDDEPFKKGGSVKRPSMQKGGAYKGKKHNYSAGGKVNELKNFKKRKV